MEVYIDNRSSSKFDENIIPKIKRCVEECLKLENFPENTEVSISLVDNEEIHELNRMYRQKDSPTDVLSFPMLEKGDKPDTAGLILLGDIIISIPKAVEQAKEYGHSFEREICYLTIHGMFHLLGYDHIDEEEKREMRAREKQVIKILNLQVE